SFVSSQLTGAFVDPALGNITWPTTGVAQGSYTATIRADDHQGGYATQSFTVTVSAPSPTTGAIYGAKFNDLNGDGQRDSGTPPPPTFQPIDITQATLSHVPRSLDYYQPGNAIVEAVSNSGGSGTSLYLVDANGTETLYASLPDVSIGDGNTIAAAQPGNFAGFTPGDIFLRGSGRSIARVSQVGTAVQEAWMTLPSYVVGVQQVTFDTTGLFGGDLLALAVGTPSNANL